MKLNEDQRQWLLDIGFKRNNKNNYPEYIYRLTENIKVIVKISGQVLLNSHEIKRPDTWKEIVEFLETLRFCFCGTEPYTDGSYCPTCQAIVANSNARRKSRNGRLQSNASPQGKHKESTKEKDKEDYPREGSNTWDQTDG